MQVNDIICYGQLVAEERRTKRQVLQGGLREVAVDLFSVKDSLEHNGIVREAKPHSITAKSHLKESRITLHPFDLSAFIQGSKFGQLFENELLDGFSLRGGNVGKLFEESLAKLDPHSALSIVP